MTEMIPATMKCKSCERLHIVNADGECRECAGKRASTLSSFRPGDGWDLGSASLATSMPLLWAMTTHTYVPGRAGWPGTQPHPGSPAWQRYLERMKKTEKVEVVEEQ